MAQGGHHGGWAYLESFGRPEALDSHLSPLLSTVLHVGSEPDGGRAITSPHPTCYRESGVGLPSCHQASGPSGSPLVLLPSPPGLLLRGPLARSFLIATPREARNELRTGVNSPIFQTSKLARTEMKSHRRNSSLPGRANRHRA